MNVSTRRMSIWGLSALVTVACSKQHIHGKVQDAFGKGLVGVTVTVEKSAFSATSNGTGDYDIDYAPGAFRLRFAKAGFTTLALDLTINQKSDFPAQTLVMFPIPEQPGIYYVGAEGLVAVPRVRVARTEQRGTWEARYRYSANPKAPGPTIPVGEVAFIDKDPKQIQLARVRDGGLLHELTYRMMMPETTYSGIIEDKSEKVGEEALTVRKVKLEAGSYAWVQMGTNMITTFPSEHCYPFLVGSPSASPPPSTTSTAPEPPPTTSQANVEVTYPGSAGAGAPAGPDAALPPQGSGASRWRTFLSQQRGLLGRIPAPRNGWEGLLPLALTRRLDRYGETYVQAINRRQLAVDACQAAEGFLERKDLRSTAKYAGLCTRHFAESNELFKASEGVFAGSVGITAAVLNGVYVTSSHAAEYGLGAWCAAKAMTCFEVADYVVLLTDFAVDVALTGADDARRALASKAFAKVLLSTDDLSTWIRQRSATELVSSDLADVLSRILRRPSLRREVLQALRAAAGNAAVGIAEDRVADIIRAAAESSHGPSLLFRIGPGDSRSGLGLTERGELTLDGQVAANGLRRFDAPRSALHVVSASPSGRLLFLVVWDQDTGGVGGYIVDSMSRKLVADVLEPLGKDSRWGKLYPLVARWVSWAPDESAAIVSPGGEVSGGLVVVTCTAPARVREVPVEGRLSPRRAGGQLLERVLYDFGSAAWLAGQTFSIRAEVHCNPYDDRECGAREQAGRPTLMRAHTVEIDARTLAVTVRPAS